MLGRRSRLGRFLRRFIKSERGAVYTEAAITLPFFIMIWAFMIYSHRLVSAKIKNNAVSKGCTWAYALNYCENTGLPAQCSSTRFSTAPPATWDDSDVASFFSSVPALSTVSDIVLGKGAYGERTDSVARPAYISGGGAGPSDVRSRHAVSCNTKPTTVGQILRDLFSALFRL